MEKVTVTVKCKNGTEKFVSVYLEEEIAAWLSTKDEDFVRRFVIAEKRSANVERKETRRHQSLDKSLESGFDIADGADVEEEIFLRNDAERLHKAIEKLEVQQKWLVEQVYYKGRAQIEIAEEMSISKAAVHYRLEKICKKLKKILEQGA